MIDIVDRLREPNRGKTEHEAADLIEELRNMLDNRNEFIAERGLWKELGQYLSEPHTAVATAKQCEP